MMKRPCRLGWFAAAALTICMVLSFSLAMAENGETAGALKKIERYSKGLKLGMEFSDATKVLGKPKEKKPVNGPKDADIPKYFAAWVQSGYSIDAQFGKDDKIVSYGIHWYGKSGAAPEFKDILGESFKETSKPGARMATVVDDGVSITWNKMQVPNTDKFIDVLTVSKKTR